jgi:hypothetical protein
MRAALTRTWCSAILVWPLLGCGEPVRLVLVEALARGGTESGGSSGANGLGGLGGLNMGANAGMAAEAGASEGGASGAAPVEPWEAPALYRASYVSHAVPGQYLKHVGGEAVVAAVDPASDADKLSASFEAIPGLWDEECISLRAVDLEASFFRHAGSSLHMHPYPFDASYMVTNLYLADATYCIEPGVADPEGVSFRSINYPQRLIHMHPNGEVWTDWIETTPEFASESTFYREVALSDR